MEGSELEALKGAQEALRRASVLFIEVHPWLLRKLGYATGPIYDLVAQAGYSILGLDGKKVERRSFVRRNVDAFRCVAIA